MGMFAPSVVPTNCGHPHFLSRYVTMNFTLSLLENCITKSTHSTAEQNVCTQWACHRQATSKHERCPCTLNWFQFPQGYGNPVRQRNTKVVVCIAFLHLWSKMIAEIWKSVLGYTKILLDVWDYGFPLVRCSRCTYRRRGKHITVCSTTIPKTLKGLRISLFHPQLNSTFICLWILLYI